MIVRQTKNTFIRVYNDKIGYVVNQETKQDRSYNETGADFLKEINRQPQKIDDIISRLVKVYRGVDFNSLKLDFVEFIEELVDHKFLVIGNSEDELNLSDLGFSYSNETPKTNAYDFTQKTKSDIKENTQDFFFEEFQRKPYLTDLQFELTSRCNERCIHCYIPNEKKNLGVDLPIDKVFSVIDEFAEMGGLHVSLSGGEVFMHKDIERILRHCVKRDLMISILSNLVLLNNKHIELLKEINPSLVQVSLYSMNAEIHDTITTIKGSFEKTKRSIEKLVATDIPVQISCPIMKVNAKGYKHVLEYAHKLKVKAQTDFIMMAQSDCNTSNLSNRISLDETEELILEMLEFDYDYLNNTLQLEPITADLARLAKQPICGVGIDKLCIAENGEVYPCAGWQGLVLGNVYDDTLNDIFENSEKIKELRKLTNSDFPKCMKCEARDYCAMCLVRNYNENGGDMMKINEHFCKVAFLNKRIVEEYFKTNSNS